MRPGRNGFVQFGCNMLTNEVGVCLLFPRVIATLCRGHKTLAILAVTIHLLNVQVASPMAPPRAFAYSVGVFRIAVGSCIARNRYWFEGAYLLGSVRKAGEAVECVPTRSMVRRAGLKNLDLLARAHA